MFRYNPKANYQPNEGRYLQILSGKDLYKHTIVVSARSHNDTFPARFPNIFVDYPLGQMHVGDKLWKNWNKALLKLWQTQLNYAVFCALSACRVSLAHLSYTKHPMIRSVYHFHVYYHVRRVLKKLRVPLPHETGFNAADNPYTESEFFKICEDYRVPNDPMKYYDEKFYWTYQHGVGWPNDYLGPDSMTQWIITPTIKTHKTNPLETPAIKSTQTVVNAERTADLEQKTIISHEDEKVALVLSLTGIFMIRFIFL